MTGEGFTEALVECLGEIDAGKLLRSRGGTDVEIPSRPDGSALCGVIGRDAVARLIDCFGPGRVTLPMGLERGPAARRARARALLAAGKSARAVALECDLHVRSVRRIGGERRNDDQMQLPFDTNGTRRR